MRNVRVRASKDNERLSTPIRLDNGCMVFLKKRDTVVGTYMVIPFRDHGGRYGDDSAYKYCSLIDLETGLIVFSDRCSRDTTVQRLLNMIPFVYLPSQIFCIPNNYDIVVKRREQYTLDIEV